jgi:hypothetical protein
MLRLLFWLLVLGAAWLVLRGELPLPGVASEAVVYEAPTPVGTCGSGGCVVVYALDVANVGRSTQESVRVRLRADALGTPLVPPTVQRAGTTTTPQGTSERAGVDAYPLGRLVPEERARLVFALRSPSLEAAPPWEKLLVGIDPALGAAERGDPAAITTGRIVHAAGRALDRAIAAVHAAR